MYKLFNDYILRTPLFPRDFYINLTNTNKVDDQKLLDAFYNPFINESIFLASPILYSEIEKLFKNEIKEPKEKQKIKNSFLKYLSRISTRPTPFGLFAGCNIGSIANENKIQIKKFEYERYTRLDMNLTGILVKKIEENLDIKNELKYYVNTSLYSIGNKIRYVESKFGKNNLLIHQLVEIDSSEYINKIIFESKNGLKISQIINLIADDEITVSEAYEFIIEIIDNQILVSELSQSVSGIENLDNILNVLKNISYATELKNIIQKIKNKINELDSLNSSVKKYIEISNILRELNINFNEKYLFQTDIFIKNNINQLDSKVNKKIYEALNILNKISPTNELINLKDFKKYFFERYENQEIELIKVLDEEIGIGYPAKSKKGDVNPLIDDLIFSPSTSNLTKNIEWTLIDSILLKKINGLSKNKDSIIELFDSDFKEIENNWDNLPDTFSTISHIVGNGDNISIVINSFVGSSAGNLIGRFCHGNPEIKTFMEKIIYFEKELNNDKILAEIVHLPEDRIGNILMRPTLRDYEIPYLSNSSKLDVKNILIDDILISVRNNRIVLKSKKYGKEILPRLTNAHNYSNSSLPIYKFLCDMQFNDKRCYLNFDWGNLKNELSFFPRVMYKDIILSNTLWKIESKNIKSILDLKNENDSIIILDKVNNWIKSENIPDLVYLVEGDNKVLINFSNIDLVKLFLIEISNKQFFLLEEFLFENEVITMDDENSSYINEFVFCLHKDIN